MMIKTENAPKVIKAFVIKLNQKNAINSNKNQLISNEYSVYKVEVIFKFNSSKAEDIFQNWLSVFRIIICSK
jgi:hypothetical protein